MASLKYLSLEFNILQSLNLDSKGYLGVELSEAKLKAINVKVLEPPVNALAGRAIASHTYLLISSKNIPLSNVPIKSIKVPAIKRNIKGFLPYLSLQLPM